MLIALLLVVKININAYILSQQQDNRGDSGCVTFLMTTCWLWFVLACMCMLTTSSRTASVIGSVQSWLCLDTDPCKRISPNHTGPSNCTQATGKCRHVLIVFPVAYEYGEVSWKLAN